MLRALFRRYSDKNISRKEFLGKKQTVRIEEIGVFTLPADNLDIDVHLYDSPGYGDQINNQHAIDEVKAFLLGAHQHWVRINGNHMTERERNELDGRMHLLFYFVAPHRMKEIDREFLIQLSGLANIVPVISKSDTMTLQERADHLLLLQNTLHSLRQQMVGSIFDFNEVPNSPDYFLPVMEGLYPADELAPSASKAAAPSAIATKMLVSAITIDSHDRSQIDDTNSTSPLFSTNVEASETIYSTKTTKPSIEETTESTLNTQFRIPMISPKDVLMTSDRKDIDQQQLGAMSTDQILESDYDHYYLLYGIGGNPHHFSSFTQLPRVPNIFGVVCDSRKYPWGELDLDNENHSDFRRLQRLVFESGKIVPMRERTQVMSRHLLEADIIALAPDQLHSTTTSAPSTNRTKRARSIDSKCELATPRQYTADQALHTDRLPRWAVKLKPFVAAYLDSNWFVLTCMGIAYLLCQFALPFLGQLIQEG